MGEELVNADVTKKLEEDVWMNVDSVELDEKDAYGCNEMIDITEPDWVLVTDEVVKLVQRELHAAMPNAAGVGGVITMEHVMTWMLLNNMVRTVRCTVLYCTGS